jgi:pyruvate formate lyase activating enzyme
MKVNLGGIVHLSTVDWTGSATTVIFLRGCPLRCPHCHNRDLQNGENQVDLTFIQGEIKTKNLRPVSSGRIPSSQIKLEKAINLADSRRGKKHIDSLISGIVLSGGEPLMQSEVVTAIARSARDAGLKVGLETCGYYPDRLDRLLQENLVDRIFLDVKAAFRDPEYERSTGMRNVAPRVQESLRACMRWKVPFEVRTTVFPDMPSPLEIAEIAGTLSELREEFPGSKLERIALQRGLPKEKEFIPISSEDLSILARSIEGCEIVKLKDYPDAKPI